MLVVVVAAAGTIAGGSASAGPAPTAAAASSSADVICSYRVTADWLRHRTSPRLLSDNATGQYARNTLVPARRDVVVNGFRQLDNGEWAFAAFLAQTNGHCPS
jgi:hypothetical protein